MASAGVEVKVRGQAPSLPARVAVERDGLVLEHHELPARATLDFRWAGDRHFLAVHDIRLLAGETRLGEAPGPTPRDLRGRLTFAPSGCAVSGWWSLSPRACSLTVIGFDDSLFGADRPRAARIAKAAPLPYFLDDGLCATLLKAQALLQSDGEPDAAHLAALALVAALELDQILSQRGRTTAKRTTRLSSRQERLVRDHIEENLHRNIALDELAALAGLSRFHFSRTFKSTFGASPQKYLTERRIESAKLLLAASTMPVAAVGRAVGFDSPARFTAAFKAVAGCPPSRYRRRPQ